MAYTESLAGGSSTLTPEQIKAADVNEDGIVDVADAQLVLLYYVETVLSGNDVTWDDLINKAK